MEVRVKVEDLARWFGISEGAVRALSRRGLVVKAGRGEFKSEESIRAYCSHLREVAAATGRPAAPGSGQGRARLAAAQGRGRGTQEPNLDVFAKLFEDPLERRLEAQAFSRREIGGYEDVLDFLVGQSIDVDVTRQPAS